MLFSHPPALDCPISLASGAGGRRAIWPEHTPGIRSPSSSHLATTVRHGSLAHAKIGTAMDSRKTWIVQLVILLITVLVFRAVLEATGTVIAVLTGVVTFIVPTIVWTRLSRHDPD